jgi:hypothetical protein
VALKDASIFTEAKLSQYTFAGKACFEYLKPVLLANHNAHNQGTGLVPTCRSLSAATSKLVAGHHSIATALA